MQDVNQLATYELFPTYMTGEFIRPNQHIISPWGLVRCLGGGVLLELDAVKDAEHFCLNEVDLKRLQAEICEHQSTSVKLITVTIARIVDVT